jgi:hypothetical protein
MVKRLVELLAFYAGLFVVMLPGMGQAQLVLYDNFSSGLINPAKWYGRQNQPGASQPMTETSRKIVEGQLQLQATDYGETTKTPSGIQAL